MMLANYVTVESFEVVSDCMTHSGAVSLTTSKIISVNISRVMANMHCDIKNHPYLILNISLKCWTSSSLE